MNLDGSGWIWVDLDGSGWIWVDLSGFGWIWVDLNRSGWIWMDLAGSEWIWLRVTENCHRELSQRIVTENCHREPVIKKHWKTLENVKMTLIIARMCDNLRTK